MSNKPRKPNWLVPFAFVILMGVILLLESQDGLPAWANDVAGILVVLSAFGAIAFWVHANAAALMEDDLCESGAVDLHITVYPPVKPPTDEVQEGPVRSYFPSDLSRN